MGDVTSRYIRHTVCGHVSVSVEDSAEVQALEEVEVLVEV